MYYLSVLQEHRWSQVSCFWQARSCPSQLHTFALSWPTQFRSSIFRMTCVICRSPEQNVNVRFSAPQLFRVLGWWQQSINQVGKPSKPGSLWDCTDCKQLKPALPKCHLPGLTPHCAPQDFTFKGTLGIKTSRFRLRTLAHLPNAEISFQLSNLDTGPFSFTTPC